MRSSSIKRNTNETQIELTLNLDGTGSSQIDTGCGFFDHMLTLFAKHAMFDLNVCCKGDMVVDAHHTVEDCGIVLGNAIKEALGDMRGITRYGFFILPMDEALILTSIDIGGRSFYASDLDIATKKLGTFETELVDEFFLAFTRALGCSLHIKQLAGKNSHHIVEGTFKSFARTLSSAVAINKRDENSIPSTKGTIL